MLYRFEGLSPEYSPFPNSSKCFLTITLLNAQAHFGSRPNDFPSLSSGCKRRNQYIQFLPTSVPARSHAICLILEMEVGQVVSAHNLTQATRTSSPSAESICWLQWACCHGLVLPFFQSWRVCLGIFHFEDTLLTETPLGISASAVNISSFVHNLYLHCFCSCG